MNTDWVEIVVSILAGLATVIPVVVKLIEYVQKSVKEKNWNELMRITIDYMKTAEQKFSDGATRKEWVLSMVKTSAMTINYDLDDAALAKISEMIDSICDAADIINAETSNGGAAPAVAE